VIWFRAGAGGGERGCPARERARRGGLPLWARESAAAASANPHSAATQCDAGNNPGAIKARQPPKPARRGAAPV
jgi:hypothetical protein